MGSSYPNRKRYSSAKTSLLIFERGGLTEEVWFYDVTSVGYALTSRRAPQPEKNDLWDMMLNYYLHFGVSSGNEASPLFIRAKELVQWQSLSPSERERTYARPQFSLEESWSEESTEVALISGDSSAVLRLAGFNQVKVEDDNSVSKHWLTSAEAIRKSRYNLSAARHRPTRSLDISHRPLVDIWSDIELIEDEIKHVMTEASFILKAEL